MRIDRFQEYLRGLLASAQDAGIAGIEEYRSPGREGRTNLRVRGEDGISIDLVIVGTARTGGDDHGKPEEITEKTEPGVQLR